MSLAGTVCILALILTIKALRARARDIAAQMDFVSTVTHELKTPLASMQLVSDTLVGGRYSSTDTVQEYAGLLSLEAARLTRSIDNLLAYARYSARTIGPAEARELNVHHLIDEALERLGPRLAERQFEVSVDIPEKLPRISGDRTALLQVFDNVIDNAIRYSRDRRALAITVSCKPREVSIVVSDQGIGIPATDLPRVLERFFRAGNAKGNGSGLGLAIAHRIIGNHRGRLSVRSQVGEGTAVEILLPIER
jgi:signal transduction histidine kinase